MSLTVLVACLGMEIKVGLRVKIGMEGIRPEPWRLGQGRCSSCGSWEHESAHEGWCGGTRS